MAITDLTSARAELVSRGYSAFAPSSDYTRMDAWLNIAKNRFEDFQFDWPWLLTTTSGTAPLTISDLRRVLSVVDSNSKTSLDRIDPNAIINFGYPDLTLTGTPAAWYRTSDTVLATYPVGSGSLSVRYVKFSPELSAGGDTPLIPARYRMAWVDLAEVEILRYGVKDDLAASTLEQSVFRRLGEIARTYAMQDQTEYTEMLVTGASVDS